MQYSPVVTYDRHKAGETSTEILRQKDIVFQDEDLAESALLCVEENPDISHDIAYGPR